MSKSQSAARKLPASLRELAHFIPQGTRDLTPDQVRFAAEVLRGAPREFKRASMEDFASVQRQVTKR